MAITLAQVDACYDAALSARRGEWSRTEAMKEVVATSGMSRNSAQNYVRSILCMLDGQCYTRTMNSAATERLLERIREEFGPFQGKSAAEAVLAHCDEFVVRARGSPQFLIREIAQRHLGEIISQIGDTDDFNSKVFASRSETRGKRAKRLAQADSTPKRRTYEVVVYDRNPDVVAEMLERAEGICMTCKVPAPFLRASDGTPYLEVHHIVPLAQGGPDTVDNAIALCPNCHRHAHLGIDREEPDHV